MSHRLVTVARVGKKGVLVIPKAVRELVGISERSLVVLEACEGKVVIKPLKVVRVRASSKARLELEEALREDYVLEEKKAERLAEKR